MTFTPYQHSLHTAAITAELYEFRGFGAAVRGLLQDDIVATNVAESVVLKEDHTAGQPLPPPSFLGNA